uniref:Uncharacterized protein n=1 Tax=Lepeophtheirus salmonis TaxID=72036 RepID=A0A0K2U760_LEPSM
MKIQVHTLFKIMKRKSIHLSDTRLYYLLFTMAEQH